MPISEARHRANEKWNAKAYDEIKVRVPKGVKEEWQAAAAEAGQSLNAYITEAVEARRGVVMVFPEGEGLEKE